MVTLKTDSLVIYWAQRLRHFYDWMHYMLLLGNKLDHI